MSKYSNFLAQIPCWHFSLDDMKLLNPSEEIVLHDCPRCFKPAYYTTKDVKIMLREDDIFTKIIPERVMEKSQTEIAELHDIFKNIDPPLKNKDGEWIN